MTTVAPVAPGCRRRTIRQAEAALHRHAPIMRAAAVRAANLTARQLAVIIIMTIIIHRTAVDQAVAALAVVDSVAEVAQVVADSVAVVVQAAAADVEDDDNR